MLAHTGQSVASVTRTPPHLPRTTVRHGLEAARPHQSCWEPGISRFWWRSQPLLHLALFARWILAVLLQQGQLGPP